MALASRTSRWLPRPTLRGGDYGDAKLDVIGAFDALDAPFDGSNVAGVRCASTQVAPVDAAP